MCDIAWIFAQLKDKMVIVLKGVENLVGKNENAVFKHFLFFPQGFQKFCFPHGRFISIL